MVMVADGGGNGDVAVESEPSKAHIRKLASFSICRRRRSSELMRNVGGSNMTQEQIMLLLA
jgi:hypothetical protein